MNHAREIANMLGLEIGEKFRIKGHPDYGTFWFVDDQSEGQRDLWQFDLEKGFYDAEIEINDTLEQLLAGFYEVEKLPWKPRFGNKYYIPIKGGNCTTIIWTDSSVDLAFWNSEMCFQTQEEAETKGKAIWEKIEREYEKA